MNEDDFKVKYSDSPFAPDWARDPALRANKGTDLDKPMPQADGADPILHDGQANKNGETAKPTSSDEPFRPTVEQIEEILWKEADDDVRVYCIMDGYWAEGLYGRLLNSPDISWAHMFQGDVATRNVQQAPFIIALKRGHKLTKWLIEEGWGQGWGIYFTASTHKAHLLYGNPRIHDKRFLHSNEEQLKLGNLTQGPEDPLWKMRRHFRQFSDVYLESENKIVDFRYYDPWVTGIFIKNCSVTEKKKFYGPVSTISSDFYVDRQRKDIDSIMCIFHEKKYELIDIQNETTLLKKFTDNDIKIKNIIHHNGLNTIQNNLIVSFEDAALEALLFSMRAKLKDEKSLRNFRTDVSDVGMNQVYEICNRNDLIQSNCIYVSLVYVGVFGVERLEVNIKKWLVEGVQPNILPSVLINFARYYGANYRKLNA
ncbi:hypothetical protein [Bartonella sp. LJL80]